MQCSSRNHIPFGPHDLGNWVKVTDAQHIQVLKPEVHLHPSTFGTAKASFGCFTLKKHMHAHVHVLQGDRIRKAPSAYQKEHYTQKHERNPSKTDHECGKEVTWECLWMWIWNETKSIEFQHTCREGLR